MSYATLPHLLLKGDNKNVLVQVEKDGQKATHNVELVCSGCSIFYATLQNNYMQAYVNLCPAFVKSLKTYFPSHSSHNCLQRFYQMLDDGHDDELPSYSGTSFIP